MNMKYKENSLKTGKGIGKDYTKPQVVCEITRATVGRVRLFFCELRKFFLKVGRVERFGYESIHA